MTTFTETITLERLTCGGCGGTFALNEVFTEAKRRERGGYTCPYCGQQRGWWESDADRLKKQLEAKERELRESKCETLRERQLREAAELEKLKALQKVQRARNGTCTICNRSFKALRRHMASQHPEHTKCVKEERA